MMTIDPKELIGKTIKEAGFRGIEGCDDVPYLDLIFEDGTELTIEGGYHEEYTGNSNEEYPATICIVKTKEGAAPQSNIKTITLAGEEFPIVGIEEVCAVNLCQNKASDASVDLGGLSFHICGACAEKLAATVAIKEIDK